MSAGVAVPRWTFASAAAAPVVLLTCSTIARSVRVRHYDPVSETLSMLAAHGRGEWIMTVGFVISASCQIVTAIGLRALRPLPRVGLALAGCCGLAVAGLPDRLGTATAHLAAVGVGAVLLAIWPLLTVSSGDPASRRRRVYRTVAVSTVLIALLGWVCYDAQQGTRLGLSERTAAVAEMLWPLVVVTLTRRRLKHSARNDLRPAAGGAAKDS